MRVFQNKNIEYKKNIFVNYLEFHNVKQEMNLEKVNCLSLLKRRRVFDLFLYE